MPNVYPTIQALVDLDGDGVVETDIREYVAGNINCDGGIKTDKDTDRTASVGSLSCNIRDDADASTWLSSNQIEGRAIELSVTYQGRTKKKWFGHVAPQTKLPSSTTGEQKGSITATDWMQIANETPVSDLVTGVNQTADTAARTLIALCPSPPTNTNFDTGTETFVTVFDGAQKNTVVFSELDKLAKSELGYLYLRQTDGETLRLENRLARGSTVPLTKIPDDIASPYHIKYATASDSGYVKYATASDSGKLQLLGQQDAILDKTMVDSAWSRGENVINEMTVTRIPRLIDGSDVVLWKTDKRIQVGYHSKFVVSGTYTRSGGNFIQAYSLVDPVVTTDYTLTENEDGTGTDYTSTLLFMYWLPSAGNFSAVFRSTQAGWLNMQVRGKGVYKDNPVDYLIENAESKTTMHRVKKDGITREYSGDYDTSKAFGDSVVALNRMPNKTMKTVTFVANSSEDLLLAFMYLDIGDKVKIVESKPAHTGYYYIQGYKFSITPGGVIIFTWYVKEEIETLCTPIAVRAPASPGGIVALDFGVLSHLANLSQFSYSMWVKRNVAAPDIYLVSHSGLDSSSATIGNALQLSNDDIAFRCYKTTTNGTWLFQNCIPDTTNWHHVVLTYDNTTDTEDPVCWVDGSLTAMTVSSAPSGLSYDDSRIPLILFNTSPTRGTPPEDIYYASPNDGSIKDVRIYDRILTNGEIATLAAGEDDYTTVPIGKLFQGIYVPTENIGDYIGGVTIEDDDLVLETVHGIASIPYHKTGDPLLTGEAI